MNVDVKALTAVAHGRYSVTRGETFQVTKGEAEELQKSGLVEIVGDAPQQEKQAPEVENKMEDAPANKAVTTAKRK